MIFVCSEITFTVSWRIFLTYS